MKQRQGFTLIELLVVVLIIGILASVALPQYFKTVEKSRAAEAISVLSSVAAAQDREYMRNGAYESLLTNLDVEVTGLKYFNAPTITVGGLSSITRTQNTPSYGNYTISLQLPAVPGAGVKTWACTPMPQCKTFLPG
jgi:prepilin-type N-terminal cleavage/methylation domain-containing protein